MIWLSMADQALAGRLCMALVHSLWIVPLLCTAAWLAGQGSVHRSYAAHAVALALSLIGLPLTFVIVHVPTSPDLHETASSAVAIEGRDDPLAQVNREVNVSSPVDVSIAPAVESAVSSVESTTGEPASAGGSLEVGGWLRWAPWIAGVYALGVLVMLARLGVGLWRAHRLATCGQVVRDGPLVDMLGRLQRQWRLRAAPALAQVERIVVPKVVGVLRPTILLPASAMTGLTAGELEMILAHELAHVRRRDMWVNLVQRLSEAVLFFNPVLWYLSRRVSVLREYCCDELACTAVEQETARTRYAQALLRVVELAGPAQRHAEVAALAASGRGPSELRRRVARLFGEPLREPVRVTRGGVFAIAAIVVALLVIPFTMSSPTAHSQPSETNAAKADDSKPAADDAAESEEYTTPITVSGKALNEDGEPIAGATIYLASWNPGYKRLAETETDEQGEYRFEDIDLPIAPADTTHGEDLGSFEVFGVADGYALAWRPRKTFYPELVTAPEFHGDSADDLPVLFGRDEPIELDLTFGEPTGFSGRVVDDEGNPIANAKLAIRYCDTRWDRPDYNLSGFEGTLNSLNQPAIVPPAVKTRTTDADGRFEFMGLPAGYRWRIDVRPPGFASRWIYVVTGHDVGNDTAARIYTDNFDLVFERPNPVTVMVVFGDSGEPAPKVSVSLGNKLASSSNTTNENGLAQLKVPEGEYTLYLLQRIGTPYLRGEKKVTINADTRDGIIAATLEPAAVAEITVVDADTGAPLEGVDVWREDFMSDGRPYREVHGYRSWEVETRISHYERPRTDKDGKMRVLFEPAAYRIGIAKEAFPEGLVPVEPDGKFVELEAGEPTEVVFEMHDPTRKPQVEETANDSDANEDSSAVGKPESKPVAANDFTDTYIAFNSGQALLDLDTGKTIGPMARGNPSGAQEYDLYANWAAADGETIPVLSGQVRKLRQVEARVWNEATPESVAELLRKTAEVAQRSQVIARPQDEYPQTLVVETRQGGQAIVQVTAYRDDIETPFSGDEGVQGFKVRYKLIKRGQAEASVDPPEPASDEIIYLQELVDTQEQIYNEIERLHKAEARGGSNDRLALARHALASARAELAEAKGQIKEAVKHYEKAVTAAEENVKAQRMAYDAGTAILSTLLDANKLRTQAKLALCEAEVKAHEAAIEADNEKSTAADENTGAIAPQILGDRFVVCPVTTDLQRNLLGSVNNPAASASLCVMVNAAAFGTADAIENDPPDFDELETALGEFAKRDNRGVWFHTIDAMGDKMASDERSKRMDVLSEHFKKLGEQAGFTNVQTAQTYGASRINGEPFAWDKYIARAREKSSNFGQLEIPIIETDELRVTEVSSFLSHLLVNADCVVDVLPVVRDADGARLHGDILPAVGDAVASLETEDGGVLQIRLRYSKTAEKELDAWINDIPSRTVFAEGLGYELCNVSKSRIAESEVPAEDDGSAE